MLVLSLYQSIFVLPKRAQMIKQAQLIQKNEDIEKSTNPTTVTPIEQTKTTNQSFKEKEIKLQTTNMDIELSNVGGSLHKLDISGSEEPLPIENMFLIKGFEKVPFVLVDQNKDSATYVYTTKEWEITKYFKIKDKNTLNVDVNIKNLSKTSRLENIYIRGLSINGSTVDTKNTRNAMLYELSILEKNHVFRKGGAYKFNSKDNKINNAPNNSEFDWIGFRDHYHAVIIKPKFETKGYENDVVSNSQLNVNVQPKTQTIEPGQTVNYNFTVVAGDQNIIWLKTYKEGFEKIVAFSGWWIIDIFAKAVYYTIPAIHSICRNWGLSIILVSLLIYGITYPLTVKSMGSMKKMQSVQPKVAALQQKYKDNPQKLNAEMVELYKREGVNPLGGCLPFLLQMPIFMALYQILWRAYYFQGKGFLWIKDLTQPDRLILLPKYLPFIGNEINILPIAMGAVMFLQQKISAKNMVVTDESQAMQQKMMRYFFPFFIGFIFYHFASGQSLYFTVFYALSTWTQWKMAKSR